MQVRVNVFYEHATHTHIVPCESYDEHSTINLPLLYFSIPNILCYKRSVYLMLQYDAKG